MAYFEAASTKTTSTAAATIFSIVPAALGSGVGVPEVREIGVFNQSGVAAEIGVGYPAALGTGGISASVTVQDVENVGRTGATKLATLYTTLQPTVPSNFFRRAQLQAVAGAGIIWTWGVGEFPIWAGATINAPVLWQFSALGVVYDFYIKVWEG